MATGTFYLSITWPPTGKQEGHGSEHYFHQGLAYKFFLFSNSETFSFPIEEDHCHGGERGSKRLERGKDSVVSYSPVSHKCPDCTVLQQIEIRGSSYLTDSFINASNRVHTVAAVIAAVAAVASDEVVSVYFIPDHLSTSMRQNGIPLFQVEGSI